MTAIGATDITYSTRVTSMPDAWTFIMEKLENLDMHSIEMVSQWWKPDGAGADEEWADTVKVSVSGRVKEEP